MEQVYPYPKDEHEHPYAYIFFHARNLGLSFDASNELAQHVFDDLGCGAPGTDHEPTIHFDALGTSGGPWQPGEWKPITEPRLTVVATAPAKVVSDMTAEERAELRAALEAAEVADRASRFSQSDESREE